MAPTPLNTRTTTAATGGTMGPGGSLDRRNSLLSPSDYEADTASIRSEQDTDSDDDERQLRARNSRELRAHDRLVLMEEEELDQLVTETRRRQERERRGSGLPLPIPNPLRSLLVRRNSADSRSRSRSPNMGGGEPQIEAAVVDEKRRQRRARRKAKKERLLADAQHGEDGELMYEMEEGGMKEGSETGESSDRDDSDEVDRMGLLGLADAKARRSRSWRRWLLIYSLIAVAFAILFLLAWKLSLGTRRKSLQQQLVSNGTAMFAPTTILISLDGFRADFLARGLTPNLNAFVKEGVSPLYMRPSFPSVTFPNHYTLATGLYPESHGVVGNTFWDPTLQEEFFYTDPARSMDPKWWMGEPFWVTAERQGLKTAIHMWPGSEAHILSTEPTYMDKYKSKEKLDKKVKRIMEFLDMPDQERPQIVAAYVPNVDSDGHKYGPNSTEIRTTIKKVDDMMGKIFAGLKERHLTNIVNVIVVSDHGMATTDTSRLMQLEDYVDLDKISHTDGWPLIGLRPKNPDDLEGMYEDLVKKTKNNPNVEVYLRDVNMPERYHFQHNERIAPLWLIPKTGWAFVKMSEMNLKEAVAKGDVYDPRGLHGYDHEHPLMRAIFVARGPAFPHKANSRVEPFQNTEVYNILCDSVGLDPMPNNGTLRLPLKPVGLHSDNGSVLETPADPEQTTSAAPSSSSAHSTKTTSVSAKESTKPPVVVNPVVSTATTAPTPSKTLGVDLPEKPKPKPKPSQEKPDKGEGEGSEDEQGGVGKTAHDFWDWFTGKVNTWWDKVTGNGGDGDTDGDDEPPADPNE